MTGTSLQSFLLPDVGEGLTEAEIVQWHVAVGDVVEVNQVVVDIETAKSVVELPSPYAGEVAELVADVGDTVDVGAPIIVIRTVAEPSPAEGPRLLVGYGAREPARRRHRGAAPVPSSASPVHARPAQHRPRAKPPVRKLASELGVDLSSLSPSGPDGTVLRSDVVEAAERLRSDVPAQPIEASVDRLAETRIPITGVRKHTAAAMVASAFTAPHVTEVVTVDVTRTLELRERVRRRPEFRDTRITPLAFVARAYLRALARTPMATARWDEEAQEIVVPATIRLGIAAATPRGLVVPNIQDAQGLDLLGLATAIDELTTTARAGRTPPGAMIGGTTTITNIGVFGIDTGTPILNPGETAILAVGAIRRLPWVVADADGERIEPRSVVQLALSFDHRVIDGQQGSQVLADTAALLADPGLAML